MENRNYENERTERLKKLLTAVTTDEELQEARKEKEEKEKKALERLEAKNAKSKAMVSYERFIKLEDRVAEDKVTQILIVRDEIYINTWNSHTREDYILQYHNVKYDENTYIYGFSFDGRYRRLTPGKIKEILEKNYDDYLNNHPFKDSKQERAVEF